MLFFGRCTRPHCRDYGSQMRAWVHTNLKIPASRMDTLPRVYVLGQHVAQVGGTRCVRCLNTQLLMKPIA